jgi:hypothetical protein
MNTLEDRVRDALRADAELVRPETIPGVPPRRSRYSSAPAGSRRTRVLIPLGAAAAVIAVVAGVSLAAPQLLSGSGPGSGSLGQNVPPFYATIAVSVVTPIATDTVVVRNTATGQITGEIQPPGNSVFAGLAATAGETMFITALNPDSGCGGSRLYSFGLNQFGVPGPLEPLNITLTGIVPQSGGDLAITPDGHTIAYASAQLGGCGPARGPDSDGEVGVINLASRTARTWPYVVPLLAGGISDLSLSADGQLLGYSNFEGTSVLVTSAPAGSLEARSRLISATLTWSALAPDGKTLYGCAVSARPGTVLPQFSATVPPLTTPPSAHKPPSDVGTLTYSQVSLTGGGEHVIASWAKVEGPQCDASIDAAGNDLLVQYPTVAEGVDDWSRPAILDLGTGQLTDINDPAFYGPFDVAW